MSKYFLLVLSIISFTSLSGQHTILIDGIYEDWTDLEPVFVDNSGDGQNNGIDIRRVWVSNDETYLYFRFELTKEINLQEDNELAIYIDLDHDINTGFKINGIGAEIRYFFGERFGVIQDNNNSEFVNFAPVGMLVAPSVSSTEFEVSLYRSIIASGININAESSIAFRLEDNAFNGDEAPDDLSGIEYIIDTDNQTDIADPFLDKAVSADFRLMSYNIENDQLFDPSRRASFRRIFQATQPDIIALQEVRDFNSQETKEIIEEFLPGETWYHKKHGFDIVTLSKFPINYSESVDGNAVFFLDVNGKEIALFNCHLPCCENDNDRQAEVDNIMEYIRELKNGESNHDIEPNTPIIITGDMNFVGDSRQPYTFLTGDIQNNGFYGPDFFPDWDETDLADANPYATNSFGNFTWINPNGSFFPGKLDWVIYTDSELSLENTYALYTPGLSSGFLNIYNLESGDALFASDHLPVIADFASSIVSVNDLLQLDISIFPNPTSNKLNINAKSNNILNISILTQNGKVLPKEEFNAQTNIHLDVSKLNAGVYFVLIQTEEGMTIKQFLKVK